MLQGTLVNDPGFHFAQIWDIMEDAHEFKFKNVYFALFAVAISLKMMSYHGLIQI